MIDPQEGGGPPPGPPEPSPHGGPVWHGTSVPQVPPIAAPPAAPGGTVGASDPDEQAAQLAQVWRESRVDAPNPRRFSSRGPRFSGRGILWVFGLLGVLLTVGILGLLGARVVSSVDRSGASSPQVSSPAGAGATVQCEANRRVLMTAIEAYEIQYAAPAPDQQTLVASGLLTEQIEGFSYDPADPVPVRGVGDCAD